MSHFAMPEYPKQWTLRAMSKIDTAGRFDEFVTLIPEDVTSILEVGCGAGYNLVALDCTRKYKLTGIDNLDFAIDEATGRVGSRVDIIKADGQAIPFDDNQFDLVLACGYLDWVSYDNLEKAISEIIRVSRKYILVIDYCFVGDMRPFHKETEIYVAVRGTPLYVVRDYLFYFENLELVRHIEILPEEFSKIPMSAWLFRR